VENEKNIITIENLYKSYGSQEVLKNINMQFNKGEIYAIIGRSGCGKTTLLRCMNCLEILNKGTLLVDGIELNSSEFENKRYFKNKKKKNDLIDFAENIREPNLKKKVYSIRKSVGYLFQSYNLFPHLNVLNNVSISLQIVYLLSKEEAYTKSENILNALGLSNLTSRYPNQLSGGQAQRVAIARALAMEPSVVLYDEPTSALDPELVSDVIGIMKDLKSDGITQIVVTHSLGLAKSIANKMFYMDNGEIIEEGSPEVFFNNPVEARTKDYINKMILE
jgi:ABC-type polar amino acid transport system ATPase subunit